MNKKRQFGKNVFTFCWGYENLTVYLAAFVTFGFYLSAIPVKFVLLLRVASKPGFGVGTAIFESRFAFKKANQRALGEKKHLPWKRVDADFQKLPSKFKLALHFLQSMRLEALRAEGRIGLPDAAQTALACGLARAAEGALGTRIGPGAVRFAVNPDFSGGGIELAIWGIFSVRAGQIILSALNGAWEIISDSISRRIQQWTSIPLRIS